VAGPQGPASPISIRVLQTAAGTLTAKCDDGETPIGGFCQTEDGSIGGVVTLKSDGTAQCVPAGTSAPGMSMKLTCATGVK
jgi:hypothetical protein